jgi:hypothetical protein
VGVQSMPLERVSVKPQSLKKLGWLDRAVAVYNYHVNLIKTEKKWTIEKTAQTLNRSVGSVSQDITVATWTRTHEKQLRRFHSMRDALEYIREKKAEQHREIELD